MRVFHSTHELSLRDRSACALLSKISLVPDLFTKGEPVCKSGPPASFPVNASFILCALHVTLSFGILKSLRITLLFSHAMQFIGSGYRLDFW